jgi:RNA-directed DNA polymerase
VVSTAPKPQGKATYVAPGPDGDWLLTEQRKLYTRSKEYPDYVFRKLWGLVTDPRNLRTAVARVAGNRGRRTAGVDGITVRSVLARGVDAFVAELRTELRSGAYRPSPVRRVLIPKAGRPGKFRPLGIPTVKDRVVQAALKNILEPIFEADFFPVSYGFRPGKSVHGALERLRLLLRPKDSGSESRRLPYQAAIEGDIKGCFDNISHHGMMERVRRRVGDAKVNRLVLAFLKAGVLSEEQFLRSDFGTPQGGILSPLLANIALGVIEERYARHVWPCLAPKAHGVRVATRESRATHARAWDRRRGRPIIYPVRYADDFLLLVGVAPGPEQESRAWAAAEREKAELATYLKERLGLELSGEKTLVTSVTRPIAFLGHHVMVRRHPVHGRLVSTSVVPRERSRRLRKRIKDLFHRRTGGRSLCDQLRQLNPILRGWGNFYRHAWGAKKVFGAIDHHVWWTILRWLRKKYQRVGTPRLLARHSRPRKSGARSRDWYEGDVSLFRMATISVGCYWHRQERSACFASHHGEPGA